MADGEIRLLSFTPTEKGADVVLSGDATAAAARVQGYFQSNGFRLEDGTSSSGTYGKGNKIARALLGGWVRREKFEVTIGAQGDSVAVQIASQMSGWSGSAVGRAREKKARKVMAEGLHAFLAGGTVEGPIP